MPGGTIRRLTRTVNRAYIIRARMSISLSEDARLLAACRPSWFHEEEAIVDDVPAGGAQALLLVDGAALLSAVTPFGPHDAVLLQSPAILNLPLALAGARGISVHRLAEGSETVSFPVEEARALAFGTVPDGPPFRRIALATLSAAVRGANASLSRFFEPLAAPPRAPARKWDVPRDVPLDDGRARDLFDAVGLDPSVLPTLGLTARFVPSGGRLLSAGEVGEEAFFVAEGRLLVTILIPGAGREALGFAGPGEIVGEMALVDDAPRSADVTAHGGPALVYALSRRVFRSLLDSGHPAGASLLGGIAAALCRRLDEALRKGAGFRLLAGPG